MARRYYCWFVPLVVWTVEGSTIDFTGTHEASTNDGADGAVFDLAETFVPHDEKGWQFDIKIGDARLPSVDIEDSNSPQLRTKQNRDPKVTDVSTSEKMTDLPQKKSTKGSKQGKAKLPENLFHTASPTVTAAPTYMQTPSPSNTMDANGIGTNMQPSVPTVYTEENTHSERPPNSPYSKTSKSIDATKKKEKYAGAVLPPTYNQEVNADGGSIKAPKKNKSSTGPDDGYPKKQESSEIDDIDAGEDNEIFSKGNNKKAKRYEYGNSKGSEHKLQKNKEEIPTPPIRNVTSAPNILMPDTPSPQRQEPSFSPTLVPMPVLASDEELPNNRSLSTISLSFEFVQSRIPLNPEVYDLVAVTSAFLESRLDVNYPGTTVLLSIVETSFRLMQPFDIILDIEVANLPSPPPTTEELDGVVRAIFQEQESLEALISVVENLPDANIFSTTTAISYMERSKNGSSSTTRSKSIVGVSAAAGVLVLILLMGGLYGQMDNSNKNQPKPSSKNYERGKVPIDGGQTVTGETCGATTIGTTSKQTRFAFDEGMSLTSRASDWTPRRGEMERLTGDDEEADCYGIRPLFSDTNDDDTSNEDEKRVDLLANPGNQPQLVRNEDSRSSNHHPVDNDDLTVDSYVPLRVVDLIKHFTPGSSRR